MAHAAARGGAPKTAHSERNHTLLFLTCVCSPSELLATSSDPPGGSDKVARNSPGGGRGERSCRRCSPRIGRRRRRRQRGRRGRRGLRTQTNREHVHARKETAGHAYTPTPTSARTCACNTQTHAQRGPRTQSHADTYDSTLWHRRHCRKVRTPATKVLTTPRTSNGRRSRGPTASATSPPAPPQESFRGAPLAAGERWTLWRSRFSGSCSFDRIICLLPGKNYSGPFFTMN